MIGNKKATWRCNAVFHAGLRVPVIDGRCLQCVIFFFLLNVGLMVFIFAQFHNNERRKTAV